MKVLLAKPRGFCAGVDRAVDTVLLALEVYGSPLYVKHAIVHNDYVVNQLEKKGVIFIEDLSKVPTHANIIFSAHGSPPSDFDFAMEKKLNVIDATCPLVTKVHIETKRYAQEDYIIFLIGHKGHIELVGTMGEAPNCTEVIESVDDVEKLDYPDDQKITILTQTTLSVDDVKIVIKAIKAKFPQAILPPSSDICYATTNRQLAVKKMSQQCDLMLVVGSTASSNTNRLVEVAKQQVPAYRINGPEEINPSWLQDKKVIGISAGASAPDDLVESVINYLKKYDANNVEEFITIDEKAWFDLPDELKKIAKERNIGKKYLLKHVIGKQSKMMV